MRKQYTEIGAWSSSEEEYEKSLREPEVLEPDHILKPGERYKKAILRMPRIRSEFQLRRISKSIEGLHLIFSGGFSIFEFADIDDFARDHQRLSLGFGGGLLEIEISEEDDEE